MLPKNALPGTSLNLWLPYTHTCTHRSLSLNQIQTNTLTLTSSWCPCLLTFAFICFGKKTRVAWYVIHTLKGKSILPQTHIWFLLFHIYNVLYFFNICFYLLYPLFLNLCHQLYFLFRCSTFPRVHFKVFSSFSSEGFNWLAVTSAEREADLKCLHMPLQNFSPPVKMSLGVW